MPSFADQAASRRKFLQFLAGSPLLAAGGLEAFAGEGPVPGSKLPDPLMWAPMRTTELIKTPKEAINVFDFEPVCRTNVPPAHFGYMASGIDDEVTLRANREGFLKFQLRPRRLVDVSKVDMSVEILGVKYPSPIVLAPVGGQRSFHDEGEVASARAAKVGNHLQILSTATSLGVEDVSAARGQPIWYQLYATNKWEVAETMVKRAEKAGCYAVAVTIDRSGGRNQETLFRMRPTDTRDCNGCHDRSSLQASMKTRAMYQGIDLSGMTNTQSSAMTWDYFKRLRDTTKMKIVLKGILAWEDAVLAADNGIDAIIVSNHGARSEDSGRSTIDALPEIVEAVKGRMPILVDSGFRRGTDIVKALCLGARAVLIEPTHQPGVFLLQTIMPQGELTLLGAVNSDLRFLSGANPLRPHVAQQAIGQQAKLEWRRGLQIRRRHDDERIASAKLENGFLDLSRRSAGHDSVPGRPARDVRQPAQPARTRGGTMTAAPEAIPRSQAGGRVAWRPWLMRSAPLRIAVILICVLWSLPTVGLLVTSFRPPEAITQTGWWEALLHPLQPGTWTLNNYTQVLGSEGMGNAFINSMIVTVPSTLIPITIAIVVGWIMYPLPF
jgi:isopentenyl diphosphate isomerase/L-lactate dehydrogenase-like FMN-dependent dehydrogenase